MKFFKWMKYKNVDYCDNNCDGCNFEDICMYRPWFCRIRSYIFTQFYNLVEKCRSDFQNILKQKYVCSKCKLIEIPSGENASIIDGYGWRKINGAWVCHHCDAHYNDCVKLNEKGEHIEITQEEFDENWNRFVENNNKKYIND
jgi:hypothetical protein